MLLLLNLNGIHAQPSSPPRSKEIACRNLEFSLYMEMKMFNENIMKSNELLDRIAKLQENMEEQTRSANRFTWVVVGLGVLQVVIAVFPYVARNWLHWQI